MILKYLEQLKQLKQQFKEQVYLNMIKNGTVAKAYENLVKEVL